MESQLFNEVRQIIEDCKVLNFPESKLALAIIRAAEKYSDKEVVSVFSCLSNDVMAEIRQQISRYETTGEYYVISSAGIKDLFGLMGRISKLVVSFN
ncbi:MULTISPECIES: hypothetical protein [Pseudomonas]|jgi:hypothetical protein|uniref:Uncharacterized protein n=1 Tax=Pseudomonas bijieensis TaxID=2681983 RepID=A0A6N1C5Z5_9PSED|nr:MULTISPECIES: hypothetical protein [Pseudomonas]MDP9782065.1 hypothetical protein [Pseudomonas fluorescens]QKS80599.1 hypothetical protein GN234_00965 [Pseudomonas bijieensis]